MNPLLSLLMRLELIIQQQDSLIQETQAKMKEMEKELTELKHLNEPKGGET
jgi:hypothetical protein